MTDERMKKGTAGQTLVPRILGGAPDTHGHKRAPRAVINMPSTCSQSTSVTLDGSYSTGFNGSDAFGLSRWEWEVDADFVDGDLTTRTPSVEWLGAGLRTVRLTVTDEDGCRDTTEVTVAVRSAAASGS